MNGESIQTNANPAPRAVPLAPEGSTMLRRYFIKPGHWEEFLAKWRQIVVIRRHHGFNILFALADYQKNIFTWAFSHSDLEAAQKLYYADPARAALNDIVDHLASTDVTKVEPVPIP